MSGGAESLRLGLVGCGRIAERGYLAAIGGLPGVELTAVADPDSDRAERLAAAAGVTAFPDVEELVGADVVEALVVATPAERHLEVAAAAAAAGLPTLVEKPPARDLAGATGLAALDPAPAIGFNRRFLQGVELSPLVPAGGWIELELEMRFRRGGWNAHLSRDEALLDAGTHLIDLAVFLSGSSPIAVRDAAIAPERASLELELGRARARIRCATDRAYAERVSIDDRAGRPIAVSRTDPLRALADRLRHGEDPLIASLRRQVAAFAATARGDDGGPLADARAGVVVMGVVEAARRSAALGGAEVTVGSEPVATSASGALTAATGAIDGDAP